MAGDSTESGPGSEGPLGDLDARLRAAREREAKVEGGGPASTSAGLGIGLRIGVELVAGIGVGVGIGWALDHWLGTKPWLMLLFFFLGAAAGILNAYRVSSGMDSSVGLGAASRRLKDKTKREP